MIRNSDKDHSSLNPGVSIGWRGEQHAASKDALKGQKWLTCFTSREQRHILLLTHPGQSLGEEKPALWAKEEALCSPVRAECILQNSPALLAPPHLSSPGVWGYRWCLHSTKAGSEVTLTPPLLHLVFNHAVKEFSFQGAPEPCCPLHPHSPAHSHTWIPAITSLGSELQTHTPISSSISRIHLSNSHFRISFLPPNHSMVSTIFRANSKLFCLRSSLFMVLQRQPP